MDQDLSNLSNNDDSDQLQRQSSWKFSVNILNDEDKPLIQDFSDFYASSSLNTRVPWIINQNEKWKIAWDLFIALVLIIIIVIIPARLAFVESEPLEWLITFYIIDFFFFIDIVLWFFTSYTDPYK